MRRIIERLIGLNQPRQSERRDVLDLAPLLHNSKMITERWEQLQTARGEYRLAAARQAGLVVHNIFTRRFVEVEAQYLSEESVPVYLADMKLTLQRIAEQLSTLDTTKVITPNQEVTQVFSAFNNLVATLKGVEQISSQPANKQKAMLLDVLLNIYQLSAAMRAEYSNDKKES